MGFTSYFEAPEKEPIIENELDHIMADINYADLCRCIRDLPSPYSEVLYFHFVYDYSLKRTADILDRKPATVKMQLVRGKKILTNKLTEAHYVNH